MINQEQKIPCPTCKTGIPFDTKQLLMGMQFVCPNCHSAIGLASESKEVVTRTLEKLESLKEKVAKKQIH